MCAHRRLRSAWASPSLIRIFDVRLEVPTAVLGLVYLYGRHKYIKGYIEDADKRIPGFWISINAQKGLVALCIVGMINTALKGYVGIHIIPWILAKYYGTEQTEDWWEF